MVLLPIIKFYPEDLGACILEVIEVYIILFDYVFGGQTPTTLNLYLPISHQICWSTGHIAKLKNATAPREPVNQNHMQESLITHSAIIVVLKV